MKKIVLTTFMLLAFATVVRAQELPGNNIPAYNPGGSTGTNYNCPAGQTYSSSGCVANPSGNLGYTPLEPIPGVTSDANNQSLDFPHLLGNIYKIAIIIGALFSVLMLTVSGIRYMLSDVVTDKEASKRRIRACLYGLVLIAASWLILNTINPQLVTFNLNPGSANVYYTPPSGASTNGSQSSPPCGSFYTNGCPSGYYCAAVNGNPDNCVSNSDQSAQKSCASTSGGVWSYDAYNGSYCYLPAYKTKTDCEAGGGRWNIGFWSNFCKT